MARDILSEFGPDANKPQASRARSGGVTEAKPCSYSPPKGPTSLGNRGPGLGGTNYGNAGTQGHQRERHSESAEALRYRGNRPMRELEDDYE